MTRRKFIQKLAGAGAAIILGVRWLAKKTTPRRFLRAAGLGRYPGPMASLPNVYKQGRWSG